MEIMISLSTDYNSYEELCKVDQEIRDTELDQREALPAVIDVMEQSLIWPRRRRRMIQRRHGLDDVTGPFYSDHYFHEGQKRPWPQV